MLDFEVKNLQLPVIAINFEELKKAVKETTDQYKGLIVTEESLPACKAMQKELAGVRIKIDNYRKDKKKELSKPIDVFESQCKELIKLIEDAEKPIKEGVSIFDNQKREEKRQEALKVITEVAQAHQLNEKYASQLTVLDKYMNLTASKREVLADVEQRAFFLKEQQTAEEERLEIYK